MSLSATEHASAPHPTTAGAATAAMTAPFGDSSAMARLAAAAAHAGNDYEYDTPARRDYSSTKSDSSATTLKSGGLAPAPAQVTPPETLAPRAPVTASVATAFPKPETSNANNLKKGNSSGLTPSPPPPNGVVDQQQQQQPQVRFGTLEDDANAASQKQRGLVSRRGRFVSPGRRSTPVPAADGNVNMEFPTYRSPSRDNSPAPSNPAASSIPSVSSISGSGSSATLASGSASYGAVSSASSSKSNGRTQFQALDRDVKEAAATVGSMASRNSSLFGASANGRTTMKTIPRKPIGSLKKPPPEALLRSRTPPPTANRKADDDDNTRTPRMDFSATAAEPYIATPTNFAVEYKPVESSSSGSAGSDKNVLDENDFDTSNVLALLQSPRGLFSPGGLLATWNTPGGAGAASGQTPTPRTPTVSTSFFFTDAANLPTRADGTPCGGRHKKEGISNIICISPLATATKPASASRSTPMDLKDVFGSAAATLTPRDTPRSEGGSASLPMLSDTPLLKSSSGGMTGSRRPLVQQRSSTNTTAVPAGSLSTTSTAGHPPNLDSLHMAEREIMEDEDLSVLLQLACNQTPRSNGTNSNSGGPVFRSPPRERSGDLSLPMMSNHDKIGKKKTDVRPPQLEMRSSTASASNTASAMEAHCGPPATEEDFKKPARSVTKTEDQPKCRPEKPAPVKRKSSLPFLTSQPQHEIPPHFYGMPPSMPLGIPPGKGGSMRVIVGAPAPPRHMGKHSGAPPGSSSLRHPPSPRGRGPHPNQHSHPGSHQPPHGPYEYAMRFGGNGMYGQYPHHPGGMPAHPHHPPPIGYHAPYHPHANHHHYPPPPPRHPGMSGQPPYAPTSSSIIPSKKQKKPVKGAGSAKRPPPSASENGAKTKKARKPSLPISSNSSGAIGSPTSSSSSKKKNRSPQITDKVERQRAAQKVHGLNAASGNKNDKAAALAAAILRGVTMRPSGKWQAQLYFAGKSRYIGVFDTREKAALAYEIAREKLKTGPQDQAHRNTENLVNAARKAAFEGVNAQSQGQQPPTSSETHGEPMPAHATSAGAGAMGPPQGAPF